MSTKTERRALLRSLASVALLAPLAVRDLAPVEEDAPQRWWEILEAMSFRLASEGRTFELVFPETIDELEPIGIPHMRAHVKLTGAIEGELWIEGDTPGKFPTRIE